MSRVGAFFDRATGLDKRVAKANQRADERLARLHQHLADVVPAPGFHLVSYGDIDEIKHESWTAAVHMVCDECGAVVAEADRHRAWHG